MSPTVITLIFLAFAIIMFVTEKIPLGLTSMIVCIGLVITGVLSVSDAFNGFINSNVILFVAMFIVGGALFETGMANEIGSLEVGKQADFLVIQPQGKIHLQPQENMLSHLVYAVKSSDVDDVYIAGEQVVKQGQVLTVEL